MEGERKTNERQREGDVKQKKSGMQALKEKAKIMRKSQGEKGREFESKEQVNLCFWKTAAGLKLEMF